MIENKPIGMRIGESIFCRGCINGKIKYYPDQSDAWIKSFMSRNGYTTKEFLRLYGYIK